jgi:hypothetical protein
MISLIYLLRKNTFQALTSLLSKKKSWPTEPFLVLDKESELFKVLEILAKNFLSSRLFDSNRKKVHKIVHKSRTIKGSESLLKSLMVPYDTNFF